MKKIPPVDLCLAVGSFCALKAHILADCTFKCGSVRLLSCGSIFSLGNQNNEILFSDNSDVFFFNRQPISGSACHND